jgi:hypothetical protein
MRNDQIMKKVLMKELAMLLIILIICINCRKPINSPPLKTKYYIISGIITSEDKPLGGVLVKFTDNTSMTTDSTGTYSVDIPENSDFKITPSKEGYIFTPSSISINKVTYNQIRNFIGRKITYFKLSGIITSEGQPLKGVLVTFSDGTSIMTDSTGTYSVRILENSDYTVRPIKTGYVFIPAFIYVKNASSDQIQDFICNQIIYYKLSGIITSEGIPLIGVLVEFSDDTSIITDSTGTYSVIVLEKSDIQAIPIKKGYIFNPSQISIQEVTSDRIQDFIGENVIFNFFPLKVGNKWKYKAEYFEGDYVYRWYQGEEDWEICNISDNHANFQLKCIFNGTMTSGYSQRDTLSVENQISLINIKIVNNQLVKENCVKDESSISIFNRFLEVFNNVSENVVIPYTQSGDTIQVADQNPRVAGLNYYYTTRYNIGFDKIEMTDLLPSWRIVIRYNLLSHELNY